MKVLTCLQGTPEWLEIRKSHFTASEASAMMGANKYGMTRNRLLHQKATGTVPDVDEAKQALFDRGHKAEADARPFAEEIIGDDLYPCTGILEVEGLPLLASFDGITMTHDIVWEHKLWNASLAESIIADDIEPHYYWQLEHQLLVSGAHRVFFSCSDGTEENLVGMLYESNPDRREQLIAGWHQFRKDLADYVPRELVEKPQAEVIMQLPALVIQVRGEVTTSNLTKFKSDAEQFLTSINTDLKTDEDFVNAKATVKYLKDVEVQIEAALNSAIAQMESVDELKRTVMMIKDNCAAKRLALDKLVIKEEKAIKERIAMDAARLYTSHINALEEEIAPLKLVVPLPDFSGAMKSQRTIASLHNKVDTELARAKIEADAVAKDIRAKLASFNACAKGYEALFPDLQQIIYKSADDLELLVSSRIEAQKKAEVAKIEAERQRIQREEEAKAEAKLKIELLAKQEENQRGKPSDTTHAEQKATEPPQVTDVSTPPTTLHIYSQEFWHDNAYIAGTRESLEMLLGTIEYVLNNAGCQGQMQSFASDGEGYTVHVLCVTNKQADAMPVPYTDEVARAQQDRMKYGPWSLLSL